MALEKQIIKADIAKSSTFDYKPRDFGGEASAVAKSFVETDTFQSNDFKISELIAHQAGISRLENDAHQDKINAQVLERLKDIEEKAFKEGYELGLIEGTEKAFQEAKVDLITKMRAFEHLLKKIEDLKTQLLVVNEGELIRLVFLTAKKMALRDLEQNREAVLTILQNVVGETQADERVVVKLNAEDLYFIESLQEKSNEHIDSLSRVKFVTDDKVKPGGCLIETEYGNVDATIEERVERTWQTLQSRIPQKSTEKKDE